MTTVEKIKAKILDLAIRGKLVPQDPNDEPASVLLERIKAEKAKLVKAKKIKKDKNPSEIVVGADGATYEKFADGTTKDISDELPFDLPQGWAWVRLGMIFEIARGGSPRPIQSYLTSEAHGLNWIKIGDASASGKYIVSTRQKIRPEGLKKTRAVVAGDLLLTNSMSFGHPYILKVDGCIHDGWLVFHPVETGINKDFFYYSLSSAFAYSQFADTASGGVVQNLNTQKVVNALFPLPPIAEQERIKNKIEELFNHVGKLNEATDGIAKVAERIDKKILNLAIRGQLVPQNQNDEPASELVKRIEAIRKSKLGGMKSRTFASDRPAYEIEPPFDIPVSWEWVNLGAISNYGECQTIAAISIPPKTWSLDLEEIEKGTGRLLVRKFAGEKASTSSKHKFSKGMILYSKLRTYLNKVLIADMDGVCTSEIIPITLFGDILPEYIRTVLMSPYFLAYTASKDYGVKMPRVGTADARAALIPLPPLSEQKRIVSKIAELRMMTRKLVTS